VQATDMLLRVLAEAGKTTAPEPFPRKTDALTQESFGSFQATFRNAFRRADAASLQSSATDSTKDRMQYDVRQARAELDSRPAATETRRMDRPRASYVSRPSVISRDADRSDVTKQAESGAGSNTTEIAQATSTQQQPRQVRNDDPKADAAGFADEQMDVNEKLEALVEKLESELNKTDEPADEDLVTALLQMLTALLQGATNDSQTTAADAAGTAAEASPGATIRLNLESDSKLLQALKAMLTAQSPTTQNVDEAGMQSATDASQLNQSSQQSNGIAEEVMVLLKLSDQKGLLIPLQQLTQEAATSGETEKSAQLTLQLTEQSSDSEPATLSINISAQALKDAKFVNLAEINAESNQAAEGNTESASDLMITVPLDKLIAASNNGTTEELIAKLKDKAGDSRLARLLEMLGVSKKELASLLVSNSEKTSQINASFPLTGQDAENVAANSEFELLTSDPMLKTTQSEILKAMDMEQLSKKISDAGKQRQELFERFQKLMGDIDSSSELAIKATGSQNGLSSFTDWLSGIAEKTANEFQKWNVATLKETTATRENASGAVDDTAGARIAFLGRTESAEAALSKVLTSRADAPRAPMPSQQLQENVMNQIVQRVQYSFLNGTNGEVRIALKPEHLGDLQMRIRIENDVVVAKFTAHSQEVKAIIENNLGQLKNALEEQGVKVGKFEVNVNTGGGGQQQQSQTWADGSGANVYDSNYGLAGIEDGLETAALDTTLAPLDESANALYGIAGLGTSGTFAGTNYLA